MRDKYLVNYQNTELTFKTKQQIQDHYNIPLYLVDKLIQKSNNSSACHTIYHNFFTNATITLLEP